MSLDGAEQLLDPDVDHELKVSAASFRDHVEVLRLTRGERRVVEVAPGAPVSQSETPSPESVPQPDAADGDNTLLTVGFIVGGVGLASAVVGAVTGVIMLGAASDVDAACGDRARCEDPVAAADAQARGEDLAIVNAVTLGIGAAGIAAGLVLVLWNVGDEPGASAVRVLPSLAGVVVDGRF